jgi:biotin synthase
LYAYNHNLDTSEEYYKEVISTRGFEDRLQTIENVRKTNLLYAAEE